MGQPVTSEPQMACDRDLVGQEAGSGTEEEAIAHYSSQNGGNAEVRAAKSGMEAGVRK